MSILKSFDNAYADAIRKEWDYIYVFMDLHSTLIKPNYKTGDIPTEFYEGALQGLKMLYAAQDTKIIMYTCSHPHEIEKYERLFCRHGIRFDFINENPEVVTTPQGYGCYDMKPYFNVLIDDKAGFDAETDWEELVDYLHGRYGAQVKTSEDWYNTTSKKAGVTILDPDGWRNGKYEFEWHEELVTYEEYENRLIQCTCMWKPIEREFG